MVMLALVAVVVVLAELAELAECPAECPVDLQALAAVACQVPVALAVACRVALVAATTWYTVELCC